MLTRSIRGSKPEFTFGPGLPHRRRAGRGVHYLLFRKAFCTAVPFLIAGTAKVTFSLHCTCSAVRPEVYQSKPFLDLQFAFVCSCSSIILFIMPVSHIGLTVSHLPTSCSFFLAALQPLGYSFIGQFGNQIGLGVAEADFFLTQETPG